MDWREAAADGLPSPRDDEPASLRQDILDELADHLDCALKRELTKNITSAEAVENVKRRFGDPRDLARRLWLEAMKDTIMSKRLTLAAMGLMMVMCLLLGWMAWTSQRASQEAAESIRKTNSELLERLSTLLARPTPRTAPERLPVRFHLFRYDGHNSPAQGFEAAFYPQGAGGALNALKRTSDANGDVDFGMLPPGSYFLDLTSPWHETTRVPLDVTPGFPISSPIACPAEDWRRVDVSFEFPGLPLLKDRDALIICRVSAQLTRQIKPGGFAWYHGDFGSQPTQEYDVVIDSTGQVVYFANALAPYPHQAPLWTNLSLHNGDQTSVSTQMLALTERFAWLADGLKQSHPANFVECRYFVKWIAVVLAPDIRRMAGQSSEKARPQTILTWEAGKTPFVCGSDQDGVIFAPSLNPVVGRKNVWTITVRPSFAQEVKRMLVASASRIPEPANGAESKADATRGGEFLKTLGIESVAPDRTSDGLTGLRLTAKGDNSRALQAGLETGDILFGINGWNVTNMRELGWVSKSLLRNEPSKDTAPVRGSHPHGAGFPGSPDFEPGPRVVALIRRGSEIELYAVPLTDSPKLDAGKASGASGFPGGGFGRRSRASNP